LFSNLQGCTNLLHTLHPNLEGNKLPSLKEWILLTDKTDYFYQKKMEVELVNPGLIGMIYRQKNLK
jgi:hypothetical protein